MIDEEGRRLLGEFVRGRRERLTPETPGERRRTPGLRREELAARAGISSVWCAWIEQGRPVQASIRTLARLAGALELSPEERARLFELADRPDPGSPAPGRTGAIVARPSAALVCMVDQSEHPAYVLDRYANAICWNQAAAALFPGCLGEGRPRNFLRYVFTDRSLRTSIPVWQDWARRLIEDPWFQIRAKKPDRKLSASLKKLRLESALFESLCAVQPASPADLDAAAVIQTGGCGMFGEMISSVSLEGTLYRVVLLKRLELNVFKGAPPSLRRSRTRGLRRARRLSDPIQDRPD